MFFWSTLVWAQEVAPFYSLMEPLAKNSYKLLFLNELFLDMPQNSMVSRFCTDVNETVAMGKALGKKPNSEQLSRYLQKLRTLEKRQDEIYRVYQQSLLSAIETKNKPKFEHLAILELEPLHKPRVRSDAIAFYKKNFDKNAIKNLDNLCQEEILEVKSIAYAAEQEKAYEEHLKTLKRSDVSKIKRGVKIGSKNSVLVIEERAPNGDIVFKAENMNPFLVTLSLDFDRLENLRSNQKIPLYVELAGYGKKEIVRLSTIGKGMEVFHTATYGWVKGSAFAMHDDNYLYGLPFAKGSSVRVSQGYNGGLSHRGLSAYAIDFPLSIGTPIYAAREGDVVGIDVSSNLGGASPEYRPYMNYVNIRHSDGTLGNYYHLKQGGSVVKIGDKVKKGQLIAYSGNTGYTTAPHLHFSVSKVDPISMRRPINLPIKIQTLQGIVTNPHEGEYYTVQ